ncbi:MAG: ABC transporter substrate-binding protein [Dethiobacteria bacterium]|jgi:iron complex transport system substrate-binding protein
MKKTIVWGLFLLFFVLAVSGCTASPAEEVGVDGQHPGKQHPGEQQPGADFPLTVEDHFGRRVEILQKPERIISLAPSNTELLFALGLDERIVGVTEYCNFPPAALAKPKAGSFSEPYLEQIVTLEPELIIASELAITAEKLQQLEELQLPILVLHPAGFEEVCQTLELLGSVTGEKRAARQLITEMQARVEAVQEKLQQLPDTRERIRVYYQVYHDPLMTAGGTSIIHEIIEMAGGKNVFAEVEAAYPKISSEAVIERDPEIILFPNTHGTAEVPVSEIVDHPGWGTITAIQKGRIFGLDPDRISRPGPRLAGAVEELAKIFYPELWEDFAGNHSGENSN